MAEQSATGSTRRYTGVHSGALLLCLAKAANAFCRSKHKHDMSNVAFIAIGKNAIASKVPHWGTIQLATMQVLC